MVALHRVATRGALPVANRAVLPYRPREMGYVPTDAYIAISTPPFAILRSDALIRERESTLMGSTRRDHVVSAQTSDFSGCKGQKRHPQAKLQSHVKIMPGVWSKAG